MRGGSLNLGNPFDMGHNEGLRSAVVLAHERRVVALLRHPGVRSYVVGATDVAPVMQGGTAASVVARHGRASRRLRQVLWGQLGKEGGKSMLARLTWALRRRYDTALVEQQWVTSMRDLVARASAAGFQRLLCCCHAEDAVEPACHADYLAETVRSLVAERRATVQVVGGGAETEDDSGSD